MKQFALITDNHEVWREEFNVTSKKTAKEEILEVIKNFNDSLKKGESKRRLYSMPIKNKKVIYFADPMGNLKEELEIEIVKPLVKKGVLFDRIRCMDTPPFKERYDILFFDWGGMSVGNTLMEHFCDKIIEDSQEYPNRLFVMVSRMTRYAMEDSIRTFGEDIKVHNIFLDIESFAEYYKKFVK